MCFDQVGSQGAGTDHEQGTRVRPRDVILREGRDTRGVPEGQFGAIEESKRETIEGRGEKVGSRDGRQGRGCIVGEDNDKFNSQIRRRRRETRQA